MSSCCHLYLIAVGELALQLAKPQVVILKFCWKTEDNVSFLLLYSTDSLSMDLAVVFNWNICVAGSESLT